MAEQKKTKIKKKEWQLITAGSIFNNAVLGETYLSNPSEMIGRYITVNLMQITNDSKSQNINLRFFIKGLDNNRGIADVIGYEVMPSSIRRLVRKEKKKVDLSFVCNTADNVCIRIKPIMIIKKNTKGSTETALIKLTHDFLIKTVSKLKYNELVLDMIGYKLQDTVKSNLRKIYPLKQFEIRQMYIIKDMPANIVQENQPAQPVREEPQKAEEAEIKEETANPSIN